MAEPLDAKAWAAQIPKPRIRVTTDGVVKGETNDSFANFLTSVGRGTNNLSQGSTYSFNPITRDRMLLELMYRGSWICGIAVDSVADDMVKYGVDFGGTLSPGDGERIEEELIRHQIWAQLRELICWGRLYGGAIAVIMIEGHNPETPLRPETVGRDQFKGLVVFDRWMVEPSLNDVVTLMGPDLGLPKYYRITADAPVFQGALVHYSRVFRYTGVDLPYWQRVTENGWGMSVYERLWDRLTAFDSTTQGIAQLVYRAYLRVVKMKDLRELASMSPSAQTGLMRRIQVMTHFQSNEGITLMDHEDEFQAVTYAFNGLDSVLLQMGQQLSGALQIPLVRLFGQSPVGLNATGESDLRLYYDGTNQQQELRLRRPLTRTITVLARSHGINLPETFAFQFRPLWQLTTQEKAQIAEVITRTVLAADELGIISREKTLEELRQQARETGIWSTISDEDIAAAAAEMPPAAELLGAGGIPGATPTGPEYGGRQMPEQAVGEPGSQQGPGSRRVAAPSLSLRPTPRSPGLSSTPAGAPY